jgi:multiple sugar transport system substrate-binding protein
MNALSRLFAGSLLALGLAAPAAAQSVEITLAHPYGKIFRPIHEQIIAEFNKLHPDVKIVLEAPQPDYEQLVQRTLAGIPQKNAPVLSFQGVNQVRQFVDAGHAFDLSAFAKDDPRWKDGSYYPDMMALGEFGGRKMAIPFAISTPIMYFNGDLFRKAGLDPANPPKTWPDVIAASKKIQSAVPQATGLFYDYLITGNWGFQVLVYSEGGSMMTADESDVAFDREPGLRAAQLLRSFVDEGVMKDWNRAQGEQAFIAGNVGFYFSSTSWLKGVEDKARFDMRTAFYPESSIGKRRLPSGGNAAVVITDDARKAKAAYEYAMFAAGPIGTEIMVKGSGYMPMHKEGTARLAKFYADHPNYKTSVEQVPFIFTWYAFPGQNTLKVIDVIKDSLQAIVAKQATPDTALKRAGDEVRKLSKGS